MRLAANFMEDKAVAGRDAVSEVLGSICYTNDRQSVYTYTKRIYL